MKTLPFLLALAFSILSLTPVARATELPASDDPIWGVLTELELLDDSDCSTLATASLITEGYSEMEAALRGAATCEALAMMPEAIQEAMTSSGIETNLFAFTDWHHISGLYFTAPEYGQMLFQNEIDFMSYDFLTFLSEFSTRASFLQDEIGLDADIVDGLADAGAVLTMYNVSSFTDPVILVNGVDDAEGVTSNLVYDVEARTITFSAAHFTTFTATERVVVTSQPTTTLSAVKAKLYIAPNGKKRVRVVIEGRKLIDGSTARLRKVEAFNNVHKSNKKLVSHFSLKKLRATGKNSFTLRVTNEYGTVVYDSKLKLSDLNYDTYTVLQ